MPYFATCPKTEEVVDREIECLFWWGREAGDRRVLLGRDYSGMMMPYTATLAPRAGYHRISANIGLPQQEEVDPVRTYRLELSSRKDFLRPEDKPSVKWCLLDVQSLTDRSKGYVDPVWADAMLAPMWDKLLETKSEKEASCFQWLQWIFDVVLHFLSRPVGSCPSCLGPVSIRNGEPGDDPYDRGRSSMYFFDCLDCRKEYGIVCPSYDRVKPIRNWFTDPGLVLERMTLMARRGLYSSPVPCLRDMNETLEFLRVCQLAGEISSKFDFGLVTRP